MRVRLAMKLYPKDTKTRTNPNAVFVHPCVTPNNRELKQRRRRRRQRERHKTMGLMSQNNALHVRFSFWYISLPSSAKQQREMTKF